MNISNINMINLILYKLLKKFQTVFFLKSIFFLLLFLSITIIFIIFSFGLLSFILYIFYSFFLLFIVIKVLIIYCLKISNYTPCSHLDNKKNNYALVYEILINPNSKSKCSREQAALERVGELLFLSHAEFYQSLTNDV